jgi:flagellar basal body-associated protein FliL
MKCKSLVPTNDLLKKEENQPMEKRKRQNLLLILAIAILLIGAIVQVYFMVTAGQKSGAQQVMESPATESTTPAQQQ